jgi:membrane protein insertase Oxa1/YidC/SpoIIIJ
MISLYVLNFGELSIELGLYISFIMVIMLFRKFLKMVIQNEKEKNSDDVSILNDEIKMNFRVIKIMCLIIVATMITTSSLSACTPWLYTA